MIEIFLPSNENYSVNGDMVLEPSVCSIDIDMASAWPLTLEHSIDSFGRWKYIVEDAVLRVPSYNGDQLFRIEKVKKSDNGIVANALPIWFDARKEVFLFDVRPTKKNGQDALNDILRGQTKYTGSSDIETKSTAYYVLKNAVEAITGADNSFLLRWGGEIIYDNYNIVINKHIGLDNGVEILYGKNVPLDGFVETVDTSNIVTRIVPKAYNGRLLPSSSPYVDSPLINNYPIIRTSVIEYDNIRLAEDNQTEDTEGLIICQTLSELHSELIKAANAEYENGLDKPEISITAEIVLLQNTEEYSRFKELETVGLGDTVYCRHDKLDITSTARVVSLTWDCLTKSVTSVTIGKHKETFVDRVVKSVTSTEKALTNDGEVKAEQINGLIDGVKTQLRIQNTIAERQDVRAILFEDLDPNSPTFGALSIGTQGFQISRERTADGRDWVWTTAATAAGIIADAITTGTLEAVNIRGSNIRGSIFETDGDNSSIILIAGYMDMYSDGERIGFIAPTTAGNVMIKSLNDNVYMNDSASFSNSGVFKVWDPSNNNKFFLFNPTTPRATIYDTDHGLFLLPERLNLYDGTYNANYGQRIARIENESSGQLIWASEYNAGDTLNYGGARFAGAIVNNLDWLDFFIPTNISPLGRTATLTIPSDCTVHVPNGYLNGTQYLSPTGITIETYTRRNGILVRFKSSNPFTNVMNNCPATVSGNFTINFS